MGSLVTSTSAKIRAVSESPGQPFLDDVALEVLEVKMDVILERAHSTPLPDLDGHRTADHVAGCEILGVRSVALHEAFTFGIGEESAFAPHDPR